MNRKLPIGPLLAGLILIVLGVLFLLQNVLNFELDWGLIWPWALIVTGVVFLLENWRHNWWALIPLALGVIFLLENMGVMQGFEIGKLWPVAMILVGLSFIVNMFARGGAAARAEKREQRVADQAYERGHRDGSEAAAPVAADRDATRDAEPLVERAEPVATTTTATAAEPVVAEPVSTRRDDAEPQLVFGDRGAADTTRLDGDVRHVPAAPVFDDGPQSAPATTSRRGGLEDPNAPGFDPSARPADRPVSRLEDPSAPGFENGPAAGPYADGSRR